MQIVIDIDEDTYKDIKRGKIYTSVRDVPQESVLAIANGTPLPTDAVDRVTIKEYLESFGTAYELGKEKGLDIALDILDKCTAEGGEKIMRELPSVTPQPCEDCVSRRAVFEILNDAYFLKIDDGAALQESVRQLPSVTPQPKMGSSSENPNKWVGADVLNHWIGAEVLDNIRSEIMRLDYDLDSVEYDYDDMAQTEMIHKICREEVLQIIDKYMAEGSEKE